MELKEFKAISFIGVPHSAHLVEMFLVGRDGEAYRLHRDVTLKQPALTPGDVVMIGVASDGKYRWARAGFFLIEKIPNPPASQMQGIWP